MRFDENLRNFRKEKDYSQEYLAIKLDVTRQTISKWENGTAMPDLKKLVELAEFFEVSMDDLLGLENVSSEKLENNNEEKIKNANEYTNQLVERISESQYASKYKRLKTALIIVSLILFILFIISINSFSDIKNKISNIETNIMFWSNEINSIRNANSNSGGEYYDIEIAIAEYYPETPEKVKAEFRYAPSVYPKNAKIYYLIPQKNGGVERFEAEDNNGEFILKTDVDLSLNKPCYFVLDDGEDIVKQETSLSWNYIYGGFGRTEPDGYYTISRTAKEKSYYFSFENSMVLWDEGIKQSEPSSVHIIVEKDGAEIYNQNMYDASDENITSLFFNGTTMSFVVNDMELGSEMKIYLKVACDNGIVYQLSFPYEFRSEAAADAGAEKLVLKGEHHCDVLFTSGGEEQIKRLW